MPEHAAMGDYLAKGASEILDGAEGLFQGAVESPINGLVQVANHAVGVTLPELHLVDSQRLSHSAGGILGSIAGKALAFWALSSLSGGLGAGGYLASSLRAGAIGAAYIGLLEPTDPNSKHFFRDRGINAAIGLATFAGMGATAAALDSTGLFAPPSVRSLAGSLVYGGMSGIASGTVHAEAESLLKKGEFARSADVLSDGLRYGLFGTIYGGLGYGYGRLTSISSRNLAGNTDSMANDDRTVYVRPWHRSEVLSRLDSQLRSIRRYGYRMWEEEPGVTQLDPAADPEVAQLVRDNADSVVKITPYRYNSGSGKVEISRHSGTGFFVDEDGTVATARHVLNMDTVDPKGISHKGSADGAFVEMTKGDIRAMKVTEANLKDLDVALLKIDKHVQEIFPKFPQVPENETFPAARLAADANLAKGDDVIALGFANGRLSASPGKLHEVKAPSEIETDPATKMFHIDEEGNTNYSIPISPKWNLTGHITPLKIEFLGPDGEVTSTYQFPRPVQVLNHLNHPQLVSNINVAPGDSGGPLFRTSDGTVVGLVTESQQGTIPLARLFRPQRAISEPVEQLHRLQKIFWMNGGR